MGLLKISEFAENDSLKSLVEAMNRKSAQNQIKEVPKENSYTNPYLDQTKALGLNLTLKTCVVNRFVRHSDREIYLNYLRREADHIYQSDELRFGVLNELEFLNDNIYPIGEYLKYRVIYFKNLFSGSLNQYNRNKYLLLWEKIFDFRKSRVYFFEQTDKTPIAEIESYFLEILDETTNGRN